MRKGKQKVTINKPRRRCWLFDELRAAALYDNGSPMHGYVPRECKVSPTKRRRG